MSRPFSGVFHIKGDRVEIVETTEQVERLFVLDKAASESETYRYNSSNQREGLTLHARTGKITLVYVDIGATIYSRTSKRDCKPFKSSDVFR